MIRRLALTAGFAILGAVAFAPNVQAQTADDQPQTGTASETVPFSGTVGSTCAFTNTQPGILEPDSIPSYVTANNTIFGGQGTTGKTTVNCSNGASITVAEPNPIQVPPGFNPSVNQAIVSNGETVISSPGPKFDGGSWSQVGSNLPITAGTDVPLDVGMIAGEKFGPAIPSGTYEYEVTLTATPD